MFCKKNLLVGFIIILSTLAMGGCSAQMPLENSHVIITSGSECFIVYSKASSDYVVRQAKNLETQIEEYCGSFVTLKSDWSSSTENKNESDVTEILFGKTDRPESVNVYNSLPENGYIIKEVNGKIVIAATSEKLLGAASLRFFSEYVSLNSGINVPENTEIVESDFSFFDIAYNGKCDTKIIIPADSSKELEKLVQYAAHQINNKCNTEIKVVKNLPSVSRHNSILITNDSKRLSDNESQISFADTTLHIEGSNELSTINAVFLFINNVVHSCDKKTDGYYHIYFPENELIEEEWDFAIPIFPGGSYMGAECISNSSYSLQFADTHEDDYRNYIEIAKILGFSSYSSSEDNGVYSSDLKKDDIDVYVTFSKEKGSVTLLITGKVFNN